MWSGCAPEDIGNPLTAKVNVAAKSVVTLRRRLAAEDDIEVSLGLIFCNFLTSADKIRNS